MLIGGGNMGKGGRVDKKSTLAVVEDDVLIDDSNDDIIVSMEDRNVDIAYSPEEIQAIKECEISINRAKHGKYLKVVPSTICDICPLGADVYGSEYPCDKYLSGALCYYDVKARKLLGVRDTVKGKTILKEMLEIYTVRFLRTASLENVQGGVINKDTDRVGKMLSDLAIKLHDMENPKVNVNASQYNIATGYPPDLLNKLFSDINSQTEKKRVIRRDESSD